MRAFVSFNDTLDLRRTMPGCQRATTVTETPPTLW
jgi:hypothetical protein